MKSREEDNSQDKSDPEFKRVHTPGWFSMRNKGPSHTADPCIRRSGHLAPSAGMRHMLARIQAQLLEEDALSVRVCITLPTCVMVQSASGKTSEPTQYNVSSKPTHTVCLKRRSFEKTYICTS